MTLQQKLPQGTMLIDEEQAKAQVKQEDEEPTEVLKKKEQIVAPNSTFYGRHRWKFVGGLLLLAALVFLIVGVVIGLDKNDSQEIDAISSQNACDNDPCQHEQAGTSCILWNNEVGYKCVEIHPNGSQDTQESNPADPCTPNPCLEHQVSQTKDDGCFCLDNPCWDDPCADDELCVFYHDGPYQCEKQQHEFDQTDPCASDPCLTDNGRIGVCVDHHDGAGGHHCDS